MHAKTVAAALVVALAAGWTLLPKAGDNKVAMFRDHLLLLGHLFGLLHPSRLGREANLEYGHITPPDPRPSNGTIPEVQGWVDVETFHKKYVWRGPVVFRGAATRENGFDIECLLEEGSPGETLTRELRGQKVRIFKDQYDDGSADFMTIPEYEALAQEATTNQSAPMPYPRAIGISKLDKCQKVLPSNFRDYHSKFASRFINDMVGDDSLVFYSSSLGTNTKMHMDSGDSFFTQVYGRKRWLFADPEYATNLRVWADYLNIVYISGYDVHREPVPLDVAIKEVILYPGDVVYFAPMTFHAVYNLDPVTLGVDFPMMDFVGSFKRHWLLTASTLFNPVLALKTVAEFVKTGKFDAYELYFDRFTKNKNQ